MRTCGFWYWKYMKDAMIIRYPHGWNRGGLFENDYAPAVTTSAWEHNNLLMEVYEEDKDIRLRRAERQDQGGGRKSDTIGTITTTCGQLHARTGWRLIEIYEKADSRMLVQG